MPMVTRKRASTESFQYSELSPISKRHRYFLEIAHRHFQLLSLSANTSLYHGGSSSHAAMERAAFSPELAWFSLDHDHGLSYARSAMRPLDSDNKRSTLTRFKPKRPLAVVDLRFSSYGADVPTDKRLDVQFMDAHDLAYRSAYVQSKSKHCFALKMAAWLADSNIDGYVCLDATMQAELILFKPSSVLTFAEHLNPDTPMVFGDGISYVMRSLIGPLAPPASPELPVVLNWNRGSIVRPLSNMTKTRLYEYARHCASTSDDFTAVTRHPIVN